MPRHDAPVTGERGAAAQDPEHGASATHARTAVESGGRKGNGALAGWYHTRTPQQRRTESGMSCGRQGALAATRAAGLQCTNGSVRADGELHSGQAIMKVLLE